MIYNLINRTKSDLPRASQVLSAYLRQENYPHWTSYFVKYKDCINDQFKFTCFVHTLDDQHRYYVLRTGCFPFMKYHCTKLKPGEEIPYVEAQNKFFNLIKLINLGIPTLAYGIMGYFMVKHVETVHTHKGDVKIYFLIKENKESIY